MGRWNLPQHFSTAVWFYEPDLKVFQPMPLTSRFVFAVDSRLCAKSASSLVETCLVSLGPSSCCPRSCCCCPKPFCSRGCWCSFNIMTLLTQRPNNGDSKSNVRYHSDTLGHNDDVDKCDGIGILVEVIWDTEEKKKRKREKRERREVCSRTFGFFGGIFVQTFDLVRCMLQTLRMLIRSLLFQTFKLSIIGRRGRGVFGRGGDKLRQPF